MKSKDVRIFEVGPRDGLQNEPKILSLSQKIVFIKDLIKSGIRDIEIGAFVRPDRVPQMAHSFELFQKIRKLQLFPEGTAAWALVPNEIGFKRALEAGVQHMGLFTAASNTFNLKNIGMSISQSLREFSKLISLGRAQYGKQLSFRGYLSTAFGCPYEGRVPLRITLKTLEQLARLDFDEFSIGDTIGVAHPRQVSEVIKGALGIVDKDKLAFHFHDTRGMALSNTLMALELGIRTFDTSAGGLGGCPFAPGATGNLATEELVYLLNGMKFKTGIHLEPLCIAAKNAGKALQKKAMSKYLTAHLASIRKVPSR